jgi:ubiquinone/menaquinone biosynthesis C-methylase UbiE
MGKEINLLSKYPVSVRDIKARSLKTADDKRIASNYGYDYFDGDRKYGYGGYHYNPKYWRNVVKDFVKYFNITSASTILDVGCAKGFMLYDMFQLIPGISLKGIDISQYAIDNALTEIKNNIVLANALNIPFPKKHFDVVISINTLHNLEVHDCATALLEIERVSRGKSFITVDAYRTDEEKQNMLDWNLTAKTIMHVDEWKYFFNKIGYTGDFYWFTP